MDEELRKVIAGVLRIAPERVSPQLAYQSVAQWDSLRHVALMLALEDHYALSLGATDAARLTSVEQIERHLRSRDTADPIGSDDPGPADSPARVMVDPGLNAVTMAYSAICDIDVDGGDLRYRGYSLADLIEHATFEEVAYCLLYGDLPTGSQRTEFNSWLRAEREIAPDLLEVVTQFRREPAESMLAAAFATRTAWQRYQTSFEELAVAAIAKVPTLVATHAALAEGRPAPAVTEEPGHAAHLLRMLNGRTPSSAEATALDRTMTTHADHGLAPSTLAIRVALGVGTPVEGALGAAAEVFAGPLHAGASRRAMETQAALSSPEDAANAARRWRAGNGRPYGFGHRVYRGSDPRSVILRETAVDLAAAVGDPGPVYQADLLVAAVTAEWGGALAPNVDCYTAAIYRLLQIPPSRAAALFTCARIVGWLSHAAEQLANNHLIRPRLSYDGPGKRPVPVEGLE